MNETGTTEKLLSAGAVAQMLSLSKRQIFRMKSAGLICPSITVGRGACRFRQSDIEKWIERGCPSRQEFETRRGVEQC
ncbi:MAG: hypothetical protein AMJ75_01330 [Phycisphaerae bacterium SM1_79]|nr:MAG: hypothetical protein AMJ75_01330 [Phycisphaerae bacterium SM1_79]